jgi:metal-responsive CopG/Arc/MetJ family transcriptional regulator
MKSSDPVRITSVSIPKSLVESLDEKRGLATRSAYITMLLRKALGVS